MLHSIRSLRYNSNITVSENAVPSHALYNLLTIQLGKELYILESLDITE